MLVIKRRCKVRAEYIGLIQYTHPEIISEAVLRLQAKAQPGAF
jgi:hypothetical protein